MTAKATVLRHAGVVVLRATTDLGGLALADDLDLFGDTSGERGRAWLAQLWQRSDVRQAIHLASPVLSRRIEQTLAGEPDARQTRRVVLSLASYLLRWQGRATPFGLFAGVAAASVGDKPVLRWGHDHQVVARADAAWLGAILGRLERHPLLLDRLPVVLNNTAVMRGDWLVICGQPPDESPAQLAPEEVSVRNIRPVGFMVQVAQKPLPFGELVKWLHAECPSVPPDQIRAMLTKLTARNVLLTALRAPMTTPDALAHVNAQLQAIGAEELSDLTEVATELATIHRDLSRLTDATTSSIGGRPAPERLADRMRAVCDAVEQPLNVDVSLDCDITLPALVIREAEAAAATLLRLTPYPFGYPHWKDFHARFKTRYGTGAVVPVRDLVADSGLGLPAGFLGSPYARIPRTMTERDHTLLALVQQAMLEERAEIVLTDAVIDSLAVGDQADVIPPPHVELAFQLHSPSLDAVADGAFRLVVAGAPRPSSSMAGRFAHLLPEAERDRLSNTYRAASDRDAVAAQLSFPARRRSSENVVRTPQLLPQVISLAEHRHPGSEGLITLDDLAVTADARQLYLVQLSIGRRIEPRIVHALEGGVLTPPLARFLAEVAIARCAVYTGFDWGAAARLPYLPRVRYGRTVLSAARWLLAAADLPGHGAAWPEWEKALHAWRRRWGVPSVIVLCESERRLPLNLDHHVHRAVLRARLQRADQVELREAPGPSDLAWIGRAHEFLVALHPARPRDAEQRPSGVPNAVPPQTAGHTTRRDAGHLPGISPWLHAQICGHPARQDEILTHHLPRLFDGWDELELWWFSRHREMTRPAEEQHLQLYLRLPASADYGPAAARIGRWAADLRDRGLVPQLRLGTYHPETGRFGHGPAMAAAEEVFAADSAAALAQITMATRTGIRAQALTVASLVDLASSYACTPFEGLRWLIDQLPQQQGRLDPALREMTLDLADSSQQWAALRALPGGGDVVAAWARRRTALAAYRPRLAAQRDPSSAMRSLLHLHHVRSLGIDPEHERVSNRLARAAALRQIARGLRNTQ
ncbi:lantibiotic dehydratase [Actinomadura miaoliensis]|uniref:Lantibiotic dehydratase n=1 Tax=Actinomadura miaoliensis TaxID=430685 RepID=A0ABP7WZY0_9ACTN